MNLVERWFAELTRRKLRRSTHRSAVDLEADIRKWINAWNKDPRPFVWTKTADQIPETLAAYRERIDDSGHSAAIWITARRRLSGTWTSLTFGAYGSEGE